MKVLWIALHLPPMSTVNGFSVEKPHEDQGLSSG